MLHQNGLAVARRELTIGTHIFMSAFFSLAHSLTCTLSPTKSKVAVARREATIVTYSFASIQGFFAYAGLFCVYRALLRVCRALWRVYSSLLWREATIVTHTSMSTLPSCTHALTYTTLIWIELALVQHELTIVTHTSTCTLLSLRLSHSHTSYTQSELPVVRLELTKSSKSTSTLPSLEHSLTYMTPTWNELAPVWRKLTIVTHTCISTLLSRIRFLIHAYMSMRPFSLTHICRCGAN